MDAVERRHALIASLNSSPTKQSADLLEQALYFRRGRNVQSVGCEDCFGIGSRPRESLMSSAIGAGRLGNRASSIFSRITELILL
jgi:hypothetical protein